MSAAWTEGLPTGPGLWLLERVETRMCTVATVLPQNDSLFLRCHFTNGPAQPLSDYTDRVVRSYGPLSEQQARNMRLWDPVPEEGACFST